MPRPHEFHHVSWHLGSGPYLEIAARSQNSRRHAVPARQQGHHPDGAGIREEELASGARSGDHAHTEAACPGPRRAGSFIRRHLDRRDQPGLADVDAAHPVPVQRVSGRAVYASVTSSIRPSPRLAANRKKPPPHSRAIPRPHAADDLHNWTICAPLPWPTRPHKQSQVFGDLSRRQGSKPVTFRGSGRQLVVRISAVRCRPCRGCSPGVRSR